VKHQAVKAMKTNAKLHAQPTSSSTATDINISRYKSLWCSTLLKKVYLSFAQLDHDRRFLQHLFYQRMFAWAPNLPGRTARSQASTSA